MFEIREDYLSGYKVLMSDERAKRPMLWRQSYERPKQWGTCPFCIENRHELSNISSISEDGRIIVLPNKYPAIEPDYGLHEVIIDSNIHDEDFADFSIANMSETFNILFSRYKVMFEHDFVKHVQIFKNDGSGSGASIPHSHWQAVAMSFVPSKQAGVHKQFERYYKEKQRSYIESLYENKGLIIYENQYAFAYMPHASPYGYGINIATIKHTESALEISGPQTKALAEALKFSIKALQRELGSFPYNICFQHAPKGKYHASHFYIELLPRTGSFGGLELGAEVYINSFFPEITAPVIRKHMSLL